MSECECPTLVRKLSVTSDGKKFLCEICGKYKSPDEVPKIKNCIEYRGHPSVYHIYYEYASKDGLIKDVFKIDSEDMFRPCAWRTFESFYLETFGELKFIDGKKEWIEFLQNCLAEREIVDVEPENEIEASIEKILFKLTADKPTDKYEDMVNPINGYIPRVKLPGAVHVLSGSMSELAKKEGIKLHDLRSSFKKNKWLLGFDRASYGSHTFRVWVLDGRLWSKEGYKAIKAGTKLEAVAETIFHTFQSQKPNTIKKLLLDRSEHQLRVYKSSEPICNMVSRDTMLRLCNEYNVDILDIKRIFISNDWLISDPFEVEIDKMYVTVFPFHTKYWDRDEFKHEFEEDETPTEEFIGEELAPIKPDIPKEEKITKEVKMALMEKAIADMSGQFHDGVPLKNILKEVKPMAKTEAMTLINALLDEGMIYSPRDGHWKVI